MLALCAAITVGAAQAASLKNECFSTLNGWTNNAQNVWIENNQSLHADIPFNLFPQTIRLESSPDASGGAFLGDYSAANIEAIGFSFRCVNVRPSDLWLVLTSGSNIVYQELAPRVSSIGAWNHFLCPLVGPGSSRWIGFNNPSIPDMVTNITRVALHVLNSGVDAQSYELDDFFLDRLPAATSMRPLGSNTTEVSWAHLRTNFTYRVECSSFAGSTWTNISTLVATSTTHAIVYTNQTPAVPALYRLYVP